MTPLSFCGKCNNLHFKIDPSGKIDRSGEIGMKMSCCGKCSNSACVDYGKCDCFDGQMDLQLELLRKSLEEGGPIPLTSSMWTNFDRIWTSESPDALI